MQGKADTSVFASFAPAGNPQYVVAFLEQSGYRGRRRRPGGAPHLGDVTAVSSRQVAPQQTGIIG